MPRLIALLPMALALTGCSDAAKPQDDARDSPATAAAEALERASSDRDRELEQTNDALIAAARQGDRREARRLERELDGLARQDEAGGEAPPGVSSRDPFEQALDRIPSAIVTSSSWP